MCKIPSITVSGPNLLIRVLENVLEQLVKWAQAALEMSSNQPILPHAILILNASQNDLGPSEWDIQAATSKLMSSLSEVMLNNETFVEASRLWRNNGRSIDTMEKLMSAYYSSFRVVRIPTTGRPNLIKAQTEKLYITIKQACDDARKRKHQLRMLVHANELQP